MSRQGPDSRDPILTDPAETHGGAAFLARHRREFSLRDGSQLCLRPIGPGDKANLKSGFERLSETSRYRRFMSPRNSLSEDQLRYFTDIDYVNHFAWAVFSLDDPAQPGVAVARYVRDTAEPDVAEPAVAVVDDYQGRGLGGLLLQLLATTAAEHGIRKFRASLLRENIGMRSLLDNLGATYRDCEFGALCADIALPEREQARTELMASLLRNACPGGARRAQGVMTGRTDRSTDEQRPRPGA